ncbi:MAG: hypothetical protein RLZZ184_2099, partial [Cyanobacteriota bacterium]
FDSLRGVAIQDSVGINSVFLPVKSSLFPDHTSKFTESNRIPIYYSSFHLFKPDFDYLLPLRLPYFASLRETKTVVHLPEIRCIKILYQTTFVFIALY